MIKKHSLSGNRLKDGTVTGRQIKDLVWHNLTLQNGWTAFPATATYAETPQYAKDAEGFVHLRGTVEGTAQTSPTFASVPAGFRSDSAHQWISISGTDGKNNVLPTNLDAAQTGELAIYGQQSDGFDFVSLDGAEYYAGG